MKSLSIALLASVFAVAAQADTGAPSTQEAGETVLTHSAPVDVGSSNEVGSYARYLMLNGKTREEAVKLAQNIDNPAPSTHFALRRPAAANAKTNQQ